MIPVAPQPEPADFDKDVRVPGLAFLRRASRPINFKGAEFWKKSLNDLRAAYNGICAYCCLWGPMNCSVDHYEPKVTNPLLAYEWGNYRLAHQKLNSYKGEKTGVLDPFHIHDGWFTLDFANCFVKPNTTMPQPVQDAVSNTIRILRLNTDDTLVEARFAVVRSYSKNHCSMDFLESYYPFIAVELKRQGKEEGIKGTIP